MEKQIAGFFKKNVTRPLLIAVTFFIVELILIRFHEPWGDEIHAWAIAGSSHSLSDLWYLSRYEGHPKLWYILLFFLHKFTDNVFYMQVLSVVVAACTVFVFCHYSPFTLAQNILFCAGYFFAYEYSIISRNYGIGLLFLFLCAGIYCQYKGERLLLLSVLFLLLFQTNVYAVIIGIPFYGYVIWNLYNDNKGSRKKIYASMAIVLFGLIIAVVSMKPPTSSAFSSWYTTIDLFKVTHVLATVFYAYFPLPQFNAHYWSSNILDGLPHHVLLQAFLAIITIICVHNLFKGSKKILVLFYVVTFGILLFTYTKYFGYLRHHGHLYILFILCYWLHSSEKTKADNSGAFGTWVKKYFVSIILVVQGAASVYANAADVSYVFSNDMPAARYLKADSLDKLPMTGDGDYAVSGIAGILNKDIYFMRPGYWGRYIILNSKWGNYVRFSEMDLLNRVDSLAEQEKTDVIVILSYNPFPNNLPQGWTFLKAFENGVIEENYFMYKASYVPPDPVKLNSSGEFLIKKGYVNQAIYLFKKAIKIKPDYGIAYMNLADCYNNGSGDYKQALTYIDSAVKYAPDNANVMFDKGAVLYNSGSYQGALEFFKRASVINPQFAVAYTSMARCCISLKDNQNAIAYLKEALKVNPAECDAYQLLAQCYKDEGNSKGADKYEKKAAECK